MNGKLLKSYSETQELINQLQKEQKAIKAEIMAQMKKSVETKGGYIAVLTDCERSSLDKNLLIEEQGKEFVDQYIKVTQYKKLEVKKAG